MLLWQRIPTTLVVNKSSSKNGALARMHMVAISMVGEVCEVAALDLTTALALKAVVDIVRMEAVEGAMVPVVEAEPSLREAVVVSPKRLKDLDNNPYRV